MSGLLCTFLPSEFEYLEILASKDANYMYPYLTIYRHLHEMRLHEEASSYSVDKSYLAVWHVSPVLSS